MHKRLSAVVFIVFSLLCFASAAYAESDITVLLNGREIELDSEPLVVDNVTMIPVRSYAEALDYNIKWVQNTQSVKLTKGRISVILKDNDNMMRISDLYAEDDDETEQVLLPVAPMIVDGVFYAPVRNVAEAFGLEIGWDDDTDSVLLSKNGYEYDLDDDEEDEDDEDARPARSVSAGDHTFFFQNEAEWELPGYGSGYCWTTSYAMLISDVTGSLVTPVDVAAVNERKCGKGSYCYHSAIADAFGVKFVSAFDEDSEFYGGRDSNSGGTKVKNPDGDEDVAIEALKEAIDNNPAGVLVRYAAYPHTMVAVGYEGDTILFNDPMQTSRSYAESSSKEGVPFEETCVGKRGIDIEDITFIQAMAEK